MSEEDRGEKGADRKGTADPPSAARRVAPFSPRSDGGDPSSERGSAGCAATSKSPPMAAAPLSDDGSLGHDWGWAPWKGNTWECRRCLIRMWSPAKPGRGPHGWDEMTCEERQVVHVVES